MLAQPHDFGSKGARGARGGSLPALGRAWIQVSPSGVPKEAQALCPKVWSERERVVVQ